MLFQAISQFAHILVIMSAVGHIGVDELAAVAVGWTVRLHWLSLSHSFPLHSTACIVTAMRALAGCFHSLNNCLLQWFNLVRSFCFGLSGAYDTFGSQAFGAGNKVGA